MKDTIDSIAAMVVNKADKEGITFKRDDPVDNLFELIHEQRVTVEDIYAAAVKKSNPEDRKKILLYFANQLVNHLAENLILSRRAASLGASRTPKEPAKTLSKSEQFLERKKKEALEKAEKEKEALAGKVEKISLEELGTELKEREKQKKDFEDKRQEEQHSAEDEHHKYKVAYQTAFELYAYIVKAAADEDTDTDKICGLIRRIGDEDLTKKQIAFDKLAQNPMSNLAVDALIAALHERNNILPVIKVLHNNPQRKVIIPLINLIAEFPSQDDLLFRGAAEKAVGETMSFMNEKAKSSGTKFLYQFSMSPKYEPTVRTIARVLTRDLKHSKTREKYFTPECLKSIRLIAEKVAEQKKKKVKVGFVTVTKQTDFSKQLLELADAAK